MVEIGKITYCEYITTGNYPLKGIANGNKDEYIFICNLTNESLSFKTFDNVLC